jgi:hypothetical protein
LLDRQREERDTFQTISIVTTPNKLSTQANKFLHQRLKKEKGWKGQKREKFDSIKRAVRVLTSSIEGVAELPVRRLGSLPNSTLALFGEEARGLSAGVRFSKSR